MPQVPNFMPIGQTSAEIRRFFDFLNMVDGHPSFSPRGIRSACVNFFFKQKELRIDFHQIFAIWYVFDHTLPT